MRISDWNSDVCSSYRRDLHVIKQVAGGGGAPYRAAIDLGHKLGQQPAVIDMGVAEDDGGQSRRIEGKGFPVERFKRQRTDRKSVVEGKGGAVSGARGRRRNKKKKNSCRSEEHG